MRFFLSVMALAIGLAACGGGGGSTPTPGGNPMPVQSPTAYSVLIKFTGGANLASQSLEHQLRYANTIYSEPLSNGSGNNQLPVEVTTAIAPHDAYCCGSSSGAAAVIVSPQPQVTPPISVSASGVNVTTTPLPYASPPPGQTPPPEPPRWLVNNNQTSPGAGSFAATVAAPVNQNDATPIYVIDHTALTCSDSQVSQVADDNIGGMAFINGVATKVTSTAAADLYIEGSFCTYNGFPGSTVTIVAPYGMVQQSSQQTPFATLKPSDWSNAETSIAFTTFESSLTAVTPLDELLLKTQDGHIVKLAIFETNYNSPYQAFTMFGYEEDGFAVDGF